MVEIFVASTAKLRAIPGSQDVYLDFESKDLSEITVQLPNSALGLLAREHPGESGSYPSPHNKPVPDPLPLGGRYRTVGHKVSRTPDGVRIVVHLQSATGARTVNLDLSPLGASQLADELYEKAAPALGRQT